MTVNNRVTRLHRQIMKTYALLWRRICHDPKSSDHERRRCSQLLAAAKRSRDLSHQIHEN